MKSFTRPLSLLLLLFFTVHSAFAQPPSNFRLIIDGTELHDYETMYFRCNNNGGTINAEYQQNSNPHLQATVQSTAITSSPSGWTFYNDSPNIPDTYTLRYNRSTPQDGLFTIQIAAPGVSVTMHVYFRTSPVVSFNSVPSLGNNQSGTVQVYVNPSYNPFSPYTSVNYTTDHGLRVNSSTSYNNSNTGDYNSASVSTLGSGGNLFVTATNACGVSPAIVTRIGTPFITPGPLLLLDANTNVWQFTQIPDGPGTSYSFYVVAGFASLTPNGGDCYVQTSGGADVCVTGTNSNGTGEAYCFNVPAGGGYLRAVSPNPAKDKLALQFNDTKSLETLPSTIYLYADNSTKAVRSVAVNDIYQRKAFEDGDFITVAVGDLPRGIYYLHVVPNENSKVPMQKIRIILE